MHDRSPILLLAALLGGCSPPPPAPSSPDAPTEPSWQLDRSTLDPAVEPCADFYQHVCGGWLANTDLPASRSAIVRAEALVEASNEAVLRELLAGRGPADNAEVERLRTLFGSCMNGPTSHDARTLSSWLARVDAVHDRYDFEVLLGDVHAVGIAALFGLSGVPNPHDPTRHRAQIHQGTFASMGHSRADAVAHIQRMFTLVGVPDAAAREQAEQVRDIEETLAAVALSFEQQFDRTRAEHPTTVDELREQVPDLDWSRYLERVGHAPSQPLNVTSPDYLRALETVLATRPPTVLAAYLRWQLLAALGPALPVELADVQLGAAWTGRARPAREQECRRATLELLGVELSRQFASAVLDAEARERAADVAEHVRATMVEQVRELEWLAADARQASARKLEATDLKLGYPDAWPATGSFELHDDAFLANSLAARAFEQARSWTRAAAPRHRESWEMTVYPNVAPGMAAARLTLANGFPDVFSNSIILPAASLQPPLFDPAAPLEVRYATLGSLVAHELTHVFDNYEYDELGSYRPLWTSEDLDAHRQRASCLIAQAEAYVIDSMHLDGHNTVDENLADLRGIEVAYQSAARELGAGMHERGADGLTPAQRFFYAYAQRWCSLRTPELERASLRNDWHAPPRFRVNGPLSNMPAFAAAFGCAEDSGMVRAPSDRCPAW